MTSDMNEKNGRVTTREFYDALLAQTKEMADMECRIMGGIGDVKQIQSDTEARLATGSARFTGQDKRIDKAEKTIEKVRNLNTFIALLGSTIAGIIGVNK